MNTTEKHRSCENIKICHQKGTMVPHFGVRNIHNGKKILNKIDIFGGCPPRCLMIYEMVSSEQKKIANK